MMSRWFFRYHFLRREELESELFELCLRLRRSRPGGDRPSRSAAALAEARRCDIRHIAIRGHIVRNDCADIDFLPQPDAHVSALLRTLHETAALLRRLAHAERGDRYLRS